MYVIVLENFGETDVNLYYNIANDSWTPQIEYATKIKNRGYANILKDVLCFKNWCNVVEVEE